MLHQPLPLLSTVALHSSWLVVIASVCDSPFSLKSTNCSAISNVVVLTPLPFSSEQALTTVHKKNSIKKNNILFFMI